MPAAVARARGHLARAACRTARATRRTWSVACAIKHVARRRRRGEACTAPVHAAPARRPATPEPRGPHPMTAPSAPSAPADLREDRHPLDAIFPPTIGRGHRRDREGRERRPDGPLEPDQQPVRRHGLPGQPEAAERAGRSRRTRRIAAIARAGRPGGHRHARRRRVPGRDRRVRRGRASRGDRHLGRASRRSAPEGAELERQVLEAGARAAGCGSSGRTAWA